MKNITLNEMFSKETFNSLEKFERKQLTNCKSLAFEYGQYQSIQKWECIDKNGKPIPWYTYPAIEYLNGIDFSDKNIFEFGCGNSSLYWAEKAKHVVSVEHDREWYEKISKSKMDNQNIILCEDEEEYPSIIEQFDNKFDVIIIDGIARLKCVDTIAEHLNLKDGYMIILDNSDWYPKTAEALRQKYNLIQADYHGFGPINAYTWTTSVMFSRNIQLVPMNEVQPSYSLCAIKQRID